jgi:thiamine-phosphate pyrophosphorylase
MRSKRIRGLYAITPETSDVDWLCARVAAVLAGGARTIQYRSKGVDARRRRQHAGRLLELCRAGGALFIVNDDVELARELRADGVHVGREDAPLEVVREALGDAALIGVSCYDSLARARAAQTSGANYVAFGSFFPSAVKPSAVRAPLELLGAARAVLDLPIVAIGGITPDNGRTLIDAGADALAVISALFQVADGAAAARRLTDLFAAREERLSIDSENT